ncbi:hypothetical protein pb186bvf_019287 [Paramecium bursaria]
MQYCPENYIACSIIYILNLSGLIAVLIIVIKNRFEYKFIIRQLNSEVDYTINHTHQKNLHIFLKYILLQGLFFFLCLNCLIMIFLWDSDFGFMEIGNLINFIILSCLFYLDYRHYYRITKQLRILIAALFMLQLLTTLTFIIERTQENQNINFDAERIGYFVNMIFLALINIISIFSPDFKYVKDYIGLQNYGSILNQSNYLIINEIGSLIIEKNEQKNHTHRQKKLPSFLEQLMPDESHEHERKKSNIALQQQFIIQPMEETQTPFDDEQSRQQKLEEYQQIKNELKQIHQQLDAKLEQYIKKEELEDEPQYITPTKVEDSKVVSFNEKMKQIEEKQREQQLLEEKKQQEQNEANKYEIKYIRIDDWEDVKEKGKRFIYYKVVYYSNTHQRDIKILKTLKEFEALHKVYDEKLLQSLLMRYIEKENEFPAIPLRKPGEKLNQKEMQQRSKQLEQFLQFIVKSCLKSPDLDDFLREKQQQKYLSEEDLDTQAKDIDQLLQQNNIENMLMNRGSMSIKKMLDFQEEEAETQKEQLSQSVIVFTEQQYEQKFDKKQFENKTMDYKFIIKETKKQGGTEFYQLTGEYDSKVYSQVWRRYNEFKELHRKILEKQITLPPELPNESPDGTNKTIYRKAALAEYVNKLLTQYSKNLLEYDINMSIYNFYALLEPILKEQEFDTPITGINVLVKPQDSKPHHKYILLDHLILELEFANSEPITDLAFYYFNIENNIVQNNIDGLHICKIFDGNTIHYQDQYNFTIDLSKYISSSKELDKVLLLAYRKDKNQNPWSDLILIQNEKLLPEDYTSLDQIIGKKKEKFAYKTAATQFTIQFECKILDCYPKNHQYFSDEVGQFFFPEGMKLAQEQKEIEYQQFVMTSEVGERQYCFCLIFYSQVNEDLYKGLFKQNGIMLSSKYNYQEQSFELLKFLYQISISKQEMPIERVIQNIIDDLHLPDYAILEYETSQKIQFYNYTSFPPSSSESFLALFSLLKIDQIVQVFQAILLEKKILIVTNNRKLPPLIIDAFISLLYPFEYNHILIPILSDDLLEYTQAPVPYILGITHGQFKKLRNNDDIQNIIIIDLDKYTVDGIQFIQDQVFEELRHNLKKLNIQINHQYQPYSKLNAYINNNLIRDTFLNVAKSILFDYKKYLKQSDFNREKYLRNHNTKFEKLFTDTRYFNYFIQCRNQLQYNDSMYEYFDDCLMNQSNNVFELAKLEIYQAKKPNLKGINGIFSYDQYPIMDDNLLIPQPKLKKQDSIYLIKISKETSLSILKQELTLIYVFWFQLLYSYLKYHQADNSYSEIIIQSLDILRHMNDQKIIIEKQIFKILFQCCSLFRRDDFALQIVQLMKQLGYQRDLLLYSNYFVYLRNKRNKQSIEPFEFILKSHYQIEAKCSKCNMLRSIEEIFANFVNETPLIPCLSRGTLGCNNQFYPQLIYDGVSTNIVKPSCVKDQILKEFYCNFIELPQINIDLKFKYKHKKQEIIFVNLATMYVQDDEEVIEGYQDFMQCVNTYRKKQLNL